MPIGGSIFILSRSRRLRGASPGYFLDYSIDFFAVRLGLVEVIPRSKGVRGKVFLSLGLSGGVEEGNLVVAASPPLRQSGRRLRRGPVPGPMPQAGIERASGPLLWRWRLWWDWSLWWGLRLVARAFSL